MTWKVKRSAFPLTSCPRKRSQTTTCLGDGRPLLNTALTAEVGAVLIPQVCGAALTQRDPGRSGSDPTGVWSSTDPQVGAVLIPQVCGDPGKPC